MLNTGDEDWRFKGSDGGTTITALHLDISEAGAATFNDSVTLKNNLSISDSAATTSGFLQASSNVLQFGTSSNDPVKFYANNTNYVTLQADGKLAVTEIRHISAGNLEIGNDDEKQIFDAAGATIQFQTADTERLRISGNNLHLNGGTDARIQLGSGGAGANQVSNNTVHIRGDGADAKYMAASGGVHIFEINGSEIKRITTSGVTYATGGEVRQHYATDNGSNKRYTAPLNPQIAQVGLQGYWDPTKATDGTDFSPASHGNGNQDLTLGSGVSHGTNSSRAYWVFDGTTNASMYGNPNLSAVNLQVLVCGYIGMM